MIRLLERLLEMLLWGVVGIATAALVLPVVIVVMVLLLVSGIIGLVLKLAGRLD